MCRFDKSTISAADIATAGTALVDSLGAWVAATPEMAVDVDGLCAALCDRTGDTVVVSDEVGLCLIAQHDVGPQASDQRAEAADAIGRQRGGR